MITVYTVAYNEEMFIQFMIDHYRERFPDCKIVIYDNMSTDLTSAIALKNKCEVIQYNTNNQFDDNQQLVVKNNCWKDASTDWVLVCDMDELLDINQTYLMYESRNNSTIISSQGYHMINDSDIMDLKSIKNGYRAEAHDKNYLFNKKFVQEINYEAGAHKSNPIGNIKFSENKYLAYHYHHLGENYTINRYKTNASRLSDNNIRNKWGFHYSFSEEKIKQDYVFYRQNAIQLRS